MCRASVAEVSFATETTTFWQFTFTMPSFSTLNATTNWLEHRRATMRDAYEVLYPERSRLGSCPSGGGEPQDGGDNADRRYKCGSARHASGWRTEEAS